MFYSVTRSRKERRIYLKIVNAASDPQTLAIKFPGASLANRGKLVMLKAKSTQATNTIAQPMNIVPIESALANVGTALHYTAPPYSIQVLDLDQR